MADLFDIVTARKLSGGGGGGTTVEALSVTQNGTYTAPSGTAYSPVTVNVSGGSSDFSTATVTVVNGVSVTFTWGMPIAISDTEEGYYIAQSDAYIDANSTSSFTAILFKGQCYLYAPQSNTLTISGNIEDDGDNYYIITGDCTITIS